MTDRLRSTEPEGLAARPDADTVLPPPDDPPYRLICELQDQMVFLLDADGHMRYANRYTLGFAGCEADGLTGLGWLEHVHPDHVTRVRAAWSEARAGRSPYEIDIPFRHAHGDWRRVSARIRPVVGRDDTIDCWIGTAADVEHRRRAEQALRESEATLRATFNVSSVGKAHVDPLTGRLLRVNRAFCRMLGYEEHELIGRTVSELTHADDRRRDLDLMKRIGAGERDEFDGEKRYLRKDGGVAWAHVNATLIRDDQGRPWRSAAVVIDITQRKQAEAERERLLHRLREIDRRKDAFLAMLSHELRNPLAPIRSAAELLGASTLSAARTRWAADVIRRQSNHMARLLDDLLDVARVTRGKLSLRPVSTTLGAIVDVALETTRPMYDAMGHRLETRLPDRGLTLHADPHRLAQVLSNLLTNAAKFSDPPGRVVLTADVSHDWLTLSVSDEGVGIDPAAQHEVFSMFAQIHARRDGVDAGLGIGLALVRAIVELHGGSVTVHSEGLGKGATFSVRLPLATTLARRQGHAAAQGIVPSSSPPSAVRITESARMLDALGSGPGADDGGTASASAPVMIDRRRRRVLIVDDNRDAADSLSMLLRESGHDTRVAYDGTDALALAARWRPDVGLIDLGMPGLDGCEVARALRARSGGEPMLLVALTGRGTSDDQRRSLAAGFDLHLTKPAPPEVLGRLLRDG